MNSKTANVVRQALSEAQNHHCAYCTVPMVFEKGHRNSVTIDHLITRKEAKDWDAQSRTAIGNKNNLVAACGFCNSSRGHTDPYEFYLSQSDMRDCVRRTGERPYPTLRAIRRMDKKLRRKKIKLWKEEAEVLVGLQKTWDDGSLTNVLMAFREAGWRM